MTAARSRSPAKQRRLLAALVVADGERALLDELVDGALGRRAPGLRPQALQVYVSQLRKVLPAAARDRDARGRIRARPSPGLVDASGSRAPRGVGRGSRGREPRPRGIARGPVRSRSGAAGRSATSPTTWRCAAEAERLEDLRLAARGGAVRRGARARAVTTRWCPRSSRLRGGQPAARARRRSTRCWRSTAAGASRTRSSTTRSAERLDELGLEPRRALRDAAAADPSTGSGARGRGARRRRRRPALPYPPTTLVGPRARARRSSSGCSSAATFGCSCSPARAGAARRASRSRPRAGPLRRSRTARRSSSWRRSTIPRSSSQTISRRLGAAAEPRREDPPRRRARAPAHGAAARRGQRRARPAGGAASSSSSSRAPRA